MEKVTYHPLLGNRKEDRVNYNIAVVMLEEDFVLDKHIGTMCLPDPEEPEFEKCNNQGVLRQSKFSFRISCSSLILVISRQDCDCFSPDRNLGKEKSN